MRADAIAPRTWLLAAVAGWAVLAWVLALFGLGGRVAPLPDDPSLAAGLPQWHAPADGRLAASLLQYAAVGEHPLFDEERQPRPFHIEGNDAGADNPVTFDFVLTSVLITPTVKMAILQRGGAQGSDEPLRLKLGEASNGWRLVDVSPRSAVLDGPQGRYTLELRVFGGVGGEAPTAMLNNPPASAPSANAAAAQAASNAAAPGATMQMFPRPNAAAPVTTSEQQLQAIRQRVEERRRQLQQQQQSQPSQSQ
jgi:general secretion pathway protein N